MSFLSDLFEGHTSNLAHDLNPSNAFSDTGADFNKQPSWLKDVEIAAPLAIGVLATGGADLGLLGGGGALSSLFGGAGVAADTGAAVDLAGTAAGAIDPLTGLAVDAGAAGGDALAGINTALGVGGSSALPSDALAFTGDTAGAGGGVAGGDLATAGTTAGAGGAGGGTSALDALSATAGAGGAGGGGGSTGILSTIAGGLKTAAPFVGAAGLAGSLFEGYEQKQQLNALNKQEAANVTQAAQTAALANSTAAPLINQGQTLMSYLTTGTLPAQFQTQVDQTIASQKAGIIQGYASRGMSTNPQQNSQLQQDLAAVDNSRNTLMTQLESQLSTAGNQMVQTANSLLSQGLAATQLESEIPIQISKLNQQLNTAMMTSISNFAAAMNGGRFTSLTANTPTAGTA